MRRDPQAALRFFLGFFLIGLPCLFGGLWLANQYRLAQCPPGTFVAGSVEEAMQYIGLMGMAAVLTFFVSRQLKRVEALRREDDRNVLPSYAYLFGFAALSTLAILGAVSRFCAADSGILYDDVALGTVKTFAWQDVTAVTTRCYFQSGKSSGWRQNLFVTLADGTRLDLMGREADMPAIYPRIVAALGDHDFTFTATIAPRCQYSHMEMLTQRP